LTLDTCHVQDYFELDSMNRDCRLEIRYLVELHKQGRVNLAITEFVHDDIDAEHRLQEWLDELHLIDVVDVVRPAEVGRARVGVNPIGSDEFVRWYLLAHRLVRQRLAGNKRGKCLDDRDWGHLHAHMLSKRDVFITKDEGILALQPELLSRFKIKVINPKDYLAAAGF
jgi:hypothetical protein